MSLNNAKEYEQEFNMKDFFIFFFNQRVYALICIVFFTFLAFIYSIFLEDKYTSSSTLYVVEDQDGGGIGSLISQYSGLAASAGVSLPSGSTSKTDIFLVTINSKEFFNHLLTFDGVKENLFAGISYDKSSNQTIFDGEAYDVESGKWLNGEPNPLIAYYKFKEDGIMSVNLDQNNNMVTLSVTHVSPQFAFYFCNLVIREINNVIRQRNLLESESSLSFLNDQYASSQQKNIKNSINQLIEAQLKIQMLANVRENYMVRPLDKPFFPIGKSGPFRLTITFLGFLLGLFLSFFGSLLALYLFPQNSIKT